MRFILAIVSFILAFALIGFGIAERTILAAPDSVQASMASAAGAAVTVVPGKTLTAFPGNQRVKVSGPGKVFVAYGRTADVLAWVGDTKYTTVGYDKETHALTGKIVAGKATQVPNPAGSDLWFQEYSKDRLVSFAANVPKEVSLLVVSDGVEPAPNEISITWPLDNSTPWSAPLVAIGALFLIAGLLLYIWALIHLRRIRGPRRKPPKMPKVPRQRRFKQPVRPAIGPAKGRRAIHRMIAVVPVLLVGTLGLAGCSNSSSSDFLGGGASTPTSRPSASALAVVSGDLQPPVVTESQAGAIVARIAQVAATADASKDPALLATRFEGPSLELRSANYAIRKIDSSYPAPAAIPSGRVELTLPQQTNTWPRTIFTVIQNTQDATLPPIALLLIQHTARENFKVQYAITLEAKATLPDVAPVSIGAARLPPDTKLLNLAPNNLAMAYGDTLLHGTDSKFINSFVTDGDSLRVQVGSVAKAAKRAALPTTASIDFSNTVGSAASIALATNKSGAIVAVSLNEVEIVKPVAAGAVVSPEGAVKTLSGLTSSTKGVTAIYGDQLLFYVPPSTSTDKIRLLGYSQGLIAAMELQ